METMLSQNGGALSPPEARAVAKEAYIYGFPMVDNCRIQYAYFVDRENPDYKAPWNQLCNIPRVFTPEDKAIQTANSDTPYSWIGLDLRAEPIVFTVPPVEKERYFSLQLIDLYTYNFDYLGSRTTGNNGGSFLIAGPSWQEEMPKGITKVIRCETEIASTQFRTQLFNPGDLDNVKRIQAKYIVQPLSAFLGQPAPEAAPAIEFIKPLTPDTQKTSLEFFNLLNFGLQFCPTHPSEKELMVRFSRIGVGAGKTFDASQLSPEVKAAIEAGMVDAWADFAGLKKRVEAGEVASGDVFGTREFLKNNYLFRMAAAVLGIYGNTKQEAMYPAYYVDEAGEKLNGANRYTLRFPPGQLPPVNAFWSITMYEQPASLLVANPLNRYLLNSTMLSEFKMDSDGGLTLLIQNESPAGDRESNWLPAPKGPFSTIMRLYWPKTEAVEGKWTAPLVKRVNGSEVEVTRETYCRAESDRTFFNVTRMASGVNRLFFFRSVTPLDQQTVVRMNKDTLYAGGIVDTSKGATITVPEMPVGRYFSVLLVDNDHYCPGVFYTSGTHELPQDTKYLAVIIRIQLLNPNDPEDIALVNKLQDQFVIKASSADPFPEPKWDMTSLAALTAKYNQEFSKFANYPDRCMGPRGAADENIRHLACAGAWGLFPNKDAIYINYNGQLPADRCHCATYRVPENNAFWSITMYGADGYMKSVNSILNALNTKMNADGTFTVYFGPKEACGDVPNRLDVSEGWNFLMRVYRPGPSVVNGSYKLPDAVVCK
jgi:hypothetical protein